MRLIKLFFAAVILFSQLACDSSEAQSNQIETAPPLPSSKIIAEKFAYPIGKIELITEAKDKKDDWYNAQDFTVNTHLGEDWNKNSGGNTDCGEPVFAAANGTIVYAENAGEGWGNVVIIEHDLPAGKKVQTLYGHLRKILKTSGEVKMREQIGEVGNAAGKYLCHLHFELREESCPMWNQAGAGYSAENKGWLNPSDFIDASQNRLR
ncbi:MAG: peptidoglycan DD-metalloendopeptidase family protein [Pyrinomonadaceae bacterium]|nr:peptidoglycan DD-metalloendopeptidase family protein [Pyrinomonadaceae bacterium]